MYNRLKIIYQLQLIDDQLDELEEMRGDLPNTVKELEGKINGVKEDISNMEMEQKESLKKRNRNELDIEKLTENQKKFKSQLYQVRNNKEYDALTKEIDHTENQIEKLIIENDSLADLSKSLTVQVEDIKPLLDELKQELKENKADIKVIVKANEKEDSLHSKVIDTIDIANVSKHIALFQQNPIEVLHKKFNELSRTSDKSVSVRTEKEWGLRQKLYYQIQELEKITKTDKLEDSGEDDYPESFKLVELISGWGLEPKILRGEPFNFCSPDNVHELDYLDESEEVYRVDWQLIVKKFEEAGIRYQDIKDFSSSKEFIDHFKKFNDRYGHDVGDQVLRMVAAKLAEVGGGGRAFRYGGEEFTILFPGRAVDESLPYLERIRKAVEETRFAVRGPGRPRRKPKKARTNRQSRREASITVSIGVAERDPHNAKPEQVLKAADRALYTAKRAGRNRIEPWSH